MKGPSVAPVGSCSSYIGQNSDGTPQTMNLGRGCTIIGIVQHEMMTHEQNRSDRG